MRDLSQSQETMIEEDLSALTSALGDYGTEILERISALPAPLSGYMRFLYSAMPLSDAVNEPFETFLDFARHGAFLREQSRWEIPEDLFLQYVLHYRVNNEAIEPNRGLFYERLSKRIPAGSMEQTALEINYCCMEEVAYRTTDERTSSPLAILRRGYGRCGEESTFAVTALRAMGIPARQVYVPRWAHCDDNHAWVEVWCDGTWHYLGACEPEPVLDRGWFTGAAGRAMLVHARVFSAITGEAALARGGKALFLNRTGAYAPARLFTVDCGAPGVQVTLELLNQAALIPIATLVSGPDGLASIIIGLGSLHLYARRGEGVTADLFVNTAETERIKLAFDQAPPQGAFDFLAPADHPAPSGKPTPEQLSRHRERLQECHTAYEKKLAGYQEAFAAVSKDIPKEGGKHLLSLARGNERTIGAFLRETPKAEAFLSLLPEKDLTDGSAAIFQSHLEEAEKDCANLPEALFLQHVLNPRIEYEPLTDWRRPLLRQLTPAEQALYRTDPREAWQRAAGMKELPELVYDPVAIAPTASLRYGVGSPRSRKMLFVALCRALGVPARLHPETGEPEYQEGEHFCSPIASKAAPSCAAVLHAEEDAKWVYGVNWTLARLGENGYETLQLKDTGWEGAAYRFSGCPGSYRLLTANRLPSGSQFAHQTIFTLTTAGETVPVPMVLREISVGDLIQQIHLPEIVLRDETGSAVRARDLLQNHRGILAWLEEGREPTEHLLNELLAMKAEYQAAEIPVVFLLRDASALRNATLARAVKELAEVHWAYGDFSETEPLARRLYTDPEKLPLVVAVDETFHAAYACGGYNVGIGALLHKLLLLC